MRQMIGNQPSGSRITTIPLPRERFVKNLQIRHRERAPNGSPRTPRPTNDKAESTIVSDRKRHTGLYTAMRTCNALISA